MPRIVQLRVTGDGPPSGSPHRRGPGPAGRPSWALRAAVLTFLLVIVLPLLILFGVAVAAAVVVFGGIAMLAAAGRRIRRDLPRHDGRVNVRVRR